MRMNIAMLVAFVAVGTDKCKKRRLMEYRQTHSLDSDKHDSAVETSRFKAFSTNSAALRLATVGAGEKEQ